MTERAHTRRGEAPPSSTSLWNEIADAGQRAMDEIRSLPRYEKATSAMRMASEAFISGMEMTKALAERVEALELKLAESTVKYCGVWQPGTRYLKGNMVTVNGSVWCANRATDGKPGEDHDGWVLAVRKGRDGRDAR